MTADRLADLTKGLEGRRVNIALTNGSRIDECQLISAGRSGDDRLWVYGNGADTFVPFVEVVDLWEVTPSGRRPER
jgi:hypothetical protein